ncbi:hypothetical protein ACJZ2D_016144 [Fusarium nematophilum]
MEEALVALPYRSLSPFSLFKPTPSPEPPPRPISITSDSSDEAHDREESEEPWYSPQPWPEPQPELLMTAPSPGIFHSRDATFAAA